jgi:hypothetical protein
VDPYDPTFGSWGRRITRLKLDCAIWWVQGQPSTHSEKLSALRFELRHLSCLAGTIPLELGLHLRPSSWKSKTKKEEKENSLHLLESLFHVCNGNMHIDFLEFFFNRIYIKLTWTRHLPYGWHFVKLQIFLIVPCIILISCVFSILQGRVEK